MKTVTPQAGPSAAEAAEMTAIATRTNNLDLLQRAFESGIGLEQFRQQIIDRLPSRKPIAPPAVLGESQRSENAPEAIGGLIGMAPGDIQRYSFARAINAAMTGKFDGLEGEAHQEYVRTAGVKPRGFCVPADVLARNFATRDHTAGTATAGGYLVTTVSSDFVTLLRNATKVQQLGARVLNGLVGNVVIPRMTAGTSATWVTENAENTESNATFGQLTLTPRRVSGYTEVSKQLIAQTTVSVDNLLQSDLAEAIGVAIDLAAIAGTGNAQPLGLLNTSGIGAVTFGAAPTWAKIVEFESDIEASNALSGSLGWLVSPTTKAKLKTTTKVSGDAGAGFLWQDGTEGNGIVNGYRAASTNQVANNIVFFGDWSQLVIGQWGGLELTVDNITKMRQGLVGINADMLVDVAVRRPEAFSVSTDSGAQA